MAKGGSGLAAPDWKARRSSLNSGAPWPTPDRRRSGYSGSSASCTSGQPTDQDRRFSDLHNLVCDPATLMVAWRRVRGNRGSRSAGRGWPRPPTTSSTVLGVERFLAELREELRAGSYRPLPVKERRSPSRAASAAGSGSRRFATASCRPPSSWCWSRSSRPTFEPCSYGFRPRTPSAGRDRRGALPQ